MPGRPLISRENRLGWFRRPRSHPTWWGSQSENCWSRSFPDWDNTRDGFHWARRASCSIKEGWWEERGRLVGRDPHTTGYSGNGMLIRVWRGFLLGAGRVSTWRSNKAKNRPAVYMDRETRGQYDGACVIWENECFRCCRYGSSNNSDQPRFAPEVEVGEAIKHGASRVV